MFEGFPEGVEIPYTPPSGEILAALAALADMVEEVPQFRPVFTSCYPTPASAVN